MSQPSDERDDLKRAVSSLLGSSAQKLRFKHVISVGIVAAGVVGAILISLNRNAIFVPDLSGTSQSPALSTPQATISLSPAATIPTIRVAVTSPTVGMVEIIVTADQPVDDTLTFMLGSKVLTPTLTDNTTTMLVAAAPGRKVAWQLKSADQVVKEGTVRVKEGNTPPTETTVPDAPTATPTKQPTHHKPPKDTPIGSPTPIDPENP